MANDQHAISYAAKAAGYASTERYCARADFLFRNVPLSHRHVLDVGCGKGAFTLWPVLQGADFALGIEPESSGSTQGSLQTLRQTIHSLGLDHKVEASAKRLDDLSTERPFDVVVMYNVINHLDEEAVQHLHKNDLQAVQRYLFVLRHLFQLMKPGGDLIVADCGRENFWSLLGLKSPFAPTINWHFHQEPKIWIPLFEQAGFHLEDWRWSSLYPFGALSANHLVQYLTASHFVLHFRRPNEDRLPPL